jgi:hypothetical protein
MVGNDVVDLRDRDSDPVTLRARFDQRVFSEVERYRMASSPEPGRERWRLWAAKEAAYKLARKLDPETVFAPSRFVVEWSEWRAQGERVGLVRHAGREQALRLREGADYVHAVTRLPSESAARPLSGLRRLTAVELASGRASAQSLAVRRFCIGVISKRLGLEARELEVRRHGRIPHLYWRGRLLPGGDLSLSHHGAFVAFAYGSTRPEVAA